MEAANTAMWERPGMNRPPVPGRCGKSSATRGSTTTVVGTAAACSGARMSGSKVKDSINTLQILSAKDGEGDDEGGRKSIERGGREGRREMPLRGSPSSLFGGFLRLKDGENNSRNVMEAAAAAVEEAVGDGCGVWRVLK